MPTLISAIIQPTLTGITAQAASASTQVTSGASRNALVGAVRNGRLREDEFQQVGEGLKQPPRADNVRTATQLHRRPDLAVGQQDIGDANQQARRAASTLCATMTTSGQDRPYRTPPNRYWKEGHRLTPPPSVTATPSSDRRTFRHDGRCTRNRVRPDRSLQSATRTAVFPSCRPSSGQLADVGRIARRDRDRSPADADAP